MNEFWDSFNNGFQAVNALKQNHALSSYRKDQTKGLNELMGVNPELGQQLQQGQQRNQLFDHQNADWQRKEAIDGGRAQAGRFVHDGDMQGAQGALDPSDFEGFDKLQDWTKTLHDRELQDVQQKAERMAMLQEAIGPIDDPQQAFQAAQRIAPQLGYQAEEMSHWTPDMFTPESKRLHNMQAMGLTKAAENARSERKMLAETSERTAHQGLYNSQASYWDARAKQPYAPPRTGGGRHPAGSVPHSQAGSGGGGEQFNVGQTYTDAQGNSATYMGNGQWQEY